jgi:hypothetical protein
MIVERGLAVTPDTMNSMGRRVAGRSWNATSGEDKAGFWQVFELAR